MLNLKIVFLILSLFITLAGSAALAQIEIEEDGTIKLPGVLIDE